MTDPSASRAVQHLAWAPRGVLAGRTFRVPVADPTPVVSLEAPGFHEVASRQVESTWVPGAGPAEPWVRHSAIFHYLRAPDRAGIGRVTVRAGGRVETSEIAVLDLGDLTGTGGRLGALLPRRWRVGRPWESTKTARTMEFEEPGRGSSPEGLEFWLGQPDEVLWRQLPPAELPKAHFVNEHHGCPSCGTRVFRHGGFYPWRRSHLPCTFLSTCPACSATYPSNRLAEGDYTSGDAVDDGYGYFDGEGRLYLFAATYHRDQLRAFGSGIAALTAALRRGPWVDETARRLGLLLARYALEELYVAAAPQFRYGPSLGVEQPWRWGQEDWMAAPDPAAALAAKGTLHYSIDTPGTARLLALAFDTVWPFLRSDEELADRVRARGLEVEGPRQVSDLVEQMLACLLQCILDFGARSNLPEESLGALALLLALDRPDAQDVVEWLYRSGPDRLGVFSTNDFFPDGSPPEASGGYNSIHTNGLFALEHRLRMLRARHPAAYPESRFPSVLEPSRAARCILQPYELTVVGRSWFQFGDGSAAGTASAIAGPAERTSLVMEPEIYGAPIDERTWRWAREYLEEPEARRTADAVLGRERLELGSTVHDRVGIAILRTRGAPERAALGIAWGDATGHRHMDLGDVQLFAWGRPFLTDLGYPQSWASISAWEAHWATHNSAWGVSEEATEARVAGRGRLVAHLALPGAELLEVEMERWTRVPGRGWRRMGIAMRRLLGLLETDGDGLAVVDLSRVRGGVEHWRICRGLEGDFLPAVRGAAAPAAPPIPERTDTVLEDLRARGRRAEGPEYEAFAFMDRSRRLEPVEFRGGSWRSSVESGVSLDLHHLGSSPGTELTIARATQAMGTPGESLYAYDALLWRREPAAAGDCSAVDLVFEPRLGEATIASARRLEPGPAAGPALAAGVEIRTRGGRRVRLHWSPGAEERTETSFADGTTLRGSLSLEVDGRLARLPEARRFAIRSVDRERSSLELDGAEAPERFARLRCLRRGPGFSYVLQSVERSAGRTWLRLDVSSVLGRSTVAAVGEGWIDLEDPLMTRTGYLEGARVVSPQGGTERLVGEVLDAAVLERGRTRLWIEPRGAAPAPGQAALVVDYVAGDVVAG